MTYASFWRIICHLLAIFVKLGEYSDNIGGFIVNLRNNRGFVVIFCNLRTILGSSGVFLHNIKVIWGQYGVI